MAELETYSKQNNDSERAVKKARSITELELFDAVFPELISLLCDSELKDKELAPTAERFQEVLQYNVPHGKKIRGQFVVMSYKCLVKHPKEEDLHIARVLGWCTELEKVGMEAVNDSIYLECAIYKLLKHFIRDKPYYVSILELFHEITLCAVQGQCLDMSPCTGCFDFTKYTMEKYKAIAKWKTAFYSFYLPVAIAMYMVSTESSAKQNWDFTYCI